MYVTKSFPGGAISNLIRNASADTLVYVNRYLGVLRAASLVNTILSPNMVTL